MPTSPSSDTAAVAADEVYLLCTLLIYIYIYTYIICSWCSIYLHPASAWEMHTTRCVHRTRSIFLPYYTYLFRFYIVLTELFVVRFLLIPTTASMLSNRDDYCKHAVHVGQHTYAMLLWILYTACVTWHDIVIRVSAAGRTREMAVTRFVSISRQHKNKNRIQRKKKSTV